jgi:transcriptional regulator with XRE-family HTH domain
VNQIEKEFLLKIGTNIDGWRKKKGFSYQALADTVDMDRSNLIRLIKGRRNITALTMHKIAQALGIDPKEFLK